MKILFITLAQSTTGPIIEIILLLLGAVLIGFLTAWFYQKSVYTPVIKKLEEENKALNERIDGLNVKIDGLNKKIESLNNDVTGLKGQIGELEKVISTKEKEIEELKKPKK
jgi:peptidoglycan hydrolase CwlO-like protein